MSSYPNTQETVSPTSNKPRAEELIQRYEQVLSGRRQFESYWQSLHDYFYVEAQDINKSYSPGNELDASCLWDSSTLEAPDVFASGFMNYLTPPTSKWFKLRHQNPKLQENKAVAKFFDDVTEAVNSTINRSNFYDQMFPSYKSSGVFGTTTLFLEEDPYEDVRFYNMPLKQVAIVEDGRGRVCAYFIEFEYTANQAASRWGKENLSRELQEEIQQGKGDTKKHKFLLFIGQRFAREVQKEDKKNLPIEALWIEVAAKSIVEESGYHEFPAMCHRFDKRPFIPWGYSPAMKALPFARILNAIAKTNLRSMMKHTDPPIAVPDNAFLMPFNQNPRAINYYRKDAMPDGKSIFPFGNFGDPNAGLQAVAFYQQEVKRLMFNDIFLAFNQITKEMNNPEVAERINEKMTMLGPAVGRYLSEVLNPVVHRIIGILQRKGSLPEAPREIVDNPFYEVDFVGQLAQAQRRTELNTLVTGLTMIGQMAQFNPEVMDKVDPDKVADEVWAITGAPVKVLRDDAEIQKIREGRAEAALKQQQMMTLESGARMAKDAGNAAAGFSKAKETNK